MSKKKGSTSSALLLMGMVILAGLVFYGQLFQENGLLIHTKEDCGQYLQSADSLFQLKQFDKALTDYQNALDCQPNDRYTKAQIRECQENLDDKFQHTFGGKQRDEGRCVIAAHGGGYVIAANTESFGNGGTDVHVMKLDRLGHLDWRRNYGGIKNETVNDFMATQDGGYLVLGATQTYGKGEEDIWLLKLNGSGRKQWAKTYGGEYREVGLQLIRLEDGNYGIVGFTASKGAGKSDAWLLKVNASGELLWNKTFGGADRDIGMGMVESQENLLTFIGYSASFNDSQITNGWIAQVDVLGDSILWQRTFGGKATDLLTDIQTSPKGGYMVAGITESFGNGGEDVWMLKIDEKGQKIWEKTVGGKGLEYVHCLISTSNGAYTIAGETTSTGAGAEDAWLFGMDENGRFLWKSELGEKGKDKANSIIELRDDGYAMTGMTTLEGGNAEIWILHLDERGKELEEGL